MLVFESSQGRQALAGCIKDAKALGLLNWPCFNSSGDYVCCRLMLKLNIALKKDVYLFHLFYVLSQELQGHVLKYKKFSIICDFGLELYSALPASRQHFVDSVADS